jgi:hypothetical protein
MQTAKCAWSSAKELAPATDFCAPSKMTLETINFETCAKLETEANCVKGCQWYKGTGVTTDPVAPGTTTPTTPTTPAQAASCQKVTGSTATDDVCVGLVATECAL